MNWNFGKRTGNMTVSNFDASHFEGGLTFTGKMCAPGVTSCGSTPGGAWRTPNGNHFGDPLKGQLPGTAQFGQQPVPIDADYRDLNGFALGSFVRGPGPDQAIPRSVPAGVIGNWAVGNDRYMASGIFGGSRVVPTQ